MEELQNRMKFNGDEFRFPVDDAIEQDGGNPVSGAALYEWLRGLAPYLNREIADVVPGQEELDDQLSRALITMGSAVTFFAQLNSKSRHLATPLPLEILHAFDTNPNAAIDSQSRFSTDPIKKSAYTDQAAYTVESVGGANKGRRVHAYEWVPQNGSNSTTKQTLQPGRVYYVKFFNYNGSTATEDRSRWGFYEANKNGVLQLNSKLPL